MFRRMWARIRQRPWVATFALALVVFGGVAASLPIYASVQMSRAKEDLREGRPGEARRRLAVCQFVWPRSPEARLLAARAARLDGDFTQAEAHLNELKTIQNGASEASQLEFLLMRAQTGEVDEVAGPLFSLIEKQHPDSGLIFETIARAYMHRLRYGPAFACLNSWVREQPDCAKAYHWRGWVLERLNKAKPAMGEYLKALELDPTLHNVRLRVAEMHLEDSNPPEALPHLERLLAEQPGRADVKARLGQCRFLQGRHDEARELSEAAVLEMPNDATLLLQLAKLDLLRKEPARAETWLRRVLKNDPGDTEAHYNLVASLQQQGKREEAAAAAAFHEKQKVLLDKANKLLRDEAERETTDPETAHTIGTMLIELGQHRLGLHWLHEALKRDPRHGPTHRLLADVYQRQGQPEKAAWHRGQPAGSASR
jgi:tetratricopeptide (TPR) repeat protein